MQWQWSGRMASVYVVAGFFCSVGVVQADVPKDNICETGVNQSPIDIQTPVEAVLDRLVFRTVRPSQINVRDEGFVFSEKGPVAIVDRHEFTLQRIEVRAPSEHLIKGQRPALELQMFHMSKLGEVLAISVFFDVGSENPHIKDLLKDLNSAAAGGGDSTFAPHALLTTYGGYFRYNGSLAKAPCTEGVIWILEKTRHEMSKEQLSAVLSLVADHTSRDPQPLHARLVLE